MLGAVLIVVGFRFATKLIHRIPGDIERRSLALILGSAVLVLVQVGVTHTV